MRSSVRSSVTLSALAVAAVLQIAFAGCVGDDPSIANVGNGDGDASTDATLGDSGGGDGNGEGGNAGDASTTIDAGTPYREVVLADAPKAYLRLGETSGVSAVDEVGKYNGTYLGGVTLGATGALHDGTSTSAHFDGVDGRVELGDGLDFVPKLHFSIEAWIRPSSFVANAQTIVAKLDTTDAGTTRHGYLLQIDPGAPGHPYSIDFGFYSATGAIFYIASPTPPTLSVFTHVVATFDGAQARLYFDGAEVATGTASVDLPNTAGPTSIGAWSSEATTHSGFDGEIDEVALYGEALTPTRIKAHFDAR